MPNISYLQLDKNGFCVSHRFSGVEIDSAEFIVGDISNLGKKWDGEKFVDAPKRYKVWSKTAFVTICGQSVFDAIVEGNSKPLRYFKYILDSADVVDLNIPQYFAMVKQLNDLKIMSNETFAALTVQE